MPAAAAVWRAKDGRDYASFHYAVEVWQADGDPYDPVALTQQARQDGREGRVYPFFYPPPALPMLAWAQPLGLQVGHRLMAALNLAALLGLAGVLVRWLRAPPWLPILLLATSSGAVETARLGQVNGVIALLIGVSAWRGGGAPVAVAALLKISPAAFLIRFAAARRWRPLVAGVGVGLGGLALGAAIVGVDRTVAFFEEVLPRLSDGGWNGLGVPLSFRANHSLAGLLHGLFPGPDEATLSPVARWVSRVLVLTAFGTLAWVGRRRRDPLGEGLLWGALSGVVLITPVYAWEHHHVLLLLPMVATGAALLQGRLPRWAWAPFGLCWAIWAWRLPWWRAAWNAAEPLRPVIEESKLMLPVLLIGLCGWGVASSPGLSERAGDAPVS